jgi:hypothetical protein
MLSHRPLRRIASVKETGCRRVAREPLSKMLLFEFDILNEFVRGVDVIELELELETKGVDLIVQQLS